MMNTITTVLEFINGKKTYIIAAVVGLEAAAQYLGYPIPSWVQSLTAALGLGAVRSAISKAKPT